MAIFHCKLLVHQRVITLFLLWSPSKIWSKNLSLQTRASSRRLRWISLFSLSSFTWVPSEARLPWESGTGTGNKTTVIPMTNMFRLPPTNTIEYPLAIKEWLAGKSLIEFDSFHIRMTIEISFRDCLMTSENIRSWLQYIPWNLRIARLVLSHWSASFIPWISMMFH